MAEERQEKKKTGIAKRIFKWIGLGLLSILLIAAIIFQAPWKVITLLAIVLLACTVLPKPARKWFWLTVGAVVIALIVWVFLPDGDGDWRPYKFDEELAALEAARAIPDEENAAVIYNELLDRYDEDTSEPNLADANTYDAIMRQPWSSKEHPEVAQWLKGQEGTIVTLMDAAKLEKCQFPINADLVNLDAQFDRNSAMREWAYLLVRAANNDIGEGRINPALEKYTTVLQMAKHQFQQPLLIDMLVGIGIEALAVKQFNRFVVTGDATEEHLSVIEAALARIKYDWSYDFPRILECEKLMAKNLWAMFYEINPKGKVRLRRNLLSLITPEAKLELAQMGMTERDLYWRGKVCKAYTILMWFYMPSTPQKAGEIIDASYERLYATAEPDFDWQKGPEEPSVKFRLNFRYLTEYLISILEPAYYRVHDLYLRVTSDQRGSRLIIALRCYKNKNGRWPETLDDIQSSAPAEIFVDPVNGDSFVYKLTEENFTLYSKGKNNIDENVKYKDGADDRLIWPRKSRKTQEKKADAE